MEHIVITNIKEYNKVNDVVDNRMKFDSSSGINDIPTEDTQPIVTLSLGGIKKYRNTLVSDLSWLWLIGAFDIMINRNHTKPYKSKLISNKSEFITAADL